MKNYKIEFSKEARRDLIDIVRYIKYVLHEPQIATRLSNKIKNNIYNLCANPKAYLIIDDEYIKKLQLMKIIIDNYIVFYKVIDEENKISIVRILYGKRNWLNLL